jgi:hypothetical protein
VLFRSMVCDLQIWCYPLSFSFVYFLSPIVACKQICMISIPLNLLKCVFWAWMDR